jgi:hypothetical protein
VVIERADVGFPEMADDVNELVAGYAVENVKRDRVEGSSPVKRVGFLVGRILGGQRATRLSR